MKCVWMVVAACALILAIVASWEMARRSVASPQPPLSQSHLLTVERIAALSVLTTLRVDVADAQVTELRGHTGSVKAVLVVRGDVTIGVDLAEARFQTVDELKRTAVLVLPQPTVQSVRLDHERTKLIGVWPAGLWEIVPGGEEADTAAINLAYRDGQRALSAVANDPALLERSRRQAERVLGAFFAALGWEVVIRWIT